MEESFLSACLTSLTGLRNLAETLGEASVNKKFESLAQLRGFLIALTDLIMTITRIVKNPMVSYRI